MSKGDDTLKPADAWNSWIQRKAVQKTDAPLGGPPPVEETGQSLALAGPPGATRSLVANEETGPIVTERYRLLAARLEGLSKHPSFRKVAVTSTLAGEGKTETSVNVAFVLARDFGRRVAVIDGDLREPSLWRYLGPEPGPGLTDVVAGRESLDAVIRPLGHQHLAVVGAGVTQLNPTRMWRSDVIQRLFTHLESQYDYIVVDTPPVLAGVDAALTADLVDGVVLVVRSGSTPRTALQKALGMLPRPKLVGTVLNGVKATDAPYYYYHYHQPRK
ncbi:MAG: CpsD/CapB family tyrosine-protein kinase [Nitrospirota bacterium]